MSKYCFLMIVIRSYVVGNYIIGIEHLLSSHIQRFCLFFMARFGHM